MQKWERCLWLIDLFSSYGELSLREVNERFMRYSRNEMGESLSERMFLRDREYIASTFQLDIEYDGRIRKYRLNNREVIRQNPLYRYLLSSMHVENLSDLLVRHRDRVMLQEPPTGTEWLCVLLDAIERRRTVVFDYRSYHMKGQLLHYELIPAFVRLFEKRWYLIGEYLNHVTTRVLALERMSDVRLGDYCLSPSEAITPDRYYGGCYGVIRDAQEPRDIYLKVYGSQVDYVRSLPLHPLQEEVETTDEYSVFHYFFRPSYDFIQQVLWHRDMVEVLSPIELRQEICAVLRKALRRYGSDGEVRI